MKVAPGLYRLELELAGGGQKLAAARPVQVFERRREAAAASSLTSVWDKSGAIRRWLADRRYSVRDGDAAQVRAGDLLVVGELPPGTDIKQIQAAVRRGGRAVILRPEAVFDAGETGGTPSRERQYSGLLEQIAGSWKPELRQYLHWQWSLHGSGSPSDGEEPRSSGNGAMKTGKAIRKVAGGKLVRIDASYGDRLEYIKVMGDFFLFPEDTIFQIEAVLQDAPVPLEHAEMVRRIEGVLRQNDAQLVGVAPEDIVQTIEEAIR